MINTDQTEQIKKISEARAKANEKIKPLVDVILRKMFEVDCCPILDSKYIETRARHVLHERLNQLNFKSDKIRKARMDFLEAVIEEFGKIQVPLPEEQDEEDRTRALVCENVVEDVMVVINDKNLLLSDEEYFNFTLEEDERLFFYNVFLTYLNPTFDQVFFALDKSVSEAIEYSLGKDKYKMTMKDFDPLVKGYSNMKK